MFRHRPQETFPHPGPDHGAVAGRPARVTKQGQPHRQSAMEPGQAPERSEARPPRTASRPGRHRGTPRQPAAQDPSRRAGIAARPTWRAPDVTFDAPIRVFEAHKFAVHLPSDGAHLPRISRHICAGRHPWPAVRIAQGVREELPELENRPHRRTGCSRVPLREVPKVHPAQRYRNGGEPERQRAGAQGTFPNAGPCSSRLPRSR